MNMPVEIEKKAKHVCLLKKICLVTSSFLYAPCSKLYLFISFQQVDIFQKYFQNNYFNYLFLDDLPA